ncbi:MAG: dihydrofolate reductase [DPANN group archaeon]|nr:dihydrofolate reductase [DPANN group archaeon]
MTLNIIAAMDEEGLIGKDNGLPWHLSSDLKHFKKTTRGKAIIMGRKTFLSLGSKPLPDRMNIVISRNPGKEKDVVWATTIEEAIKKAEQHHKDIFVIGGRSVYEQFIPLADKLYISHVEGHHEGNVHFPSYDRSAWEVEHEEQKEGFLFRIYRRRQG